MCRWTESSRLHHKERRVYLALPRQMASNRTTLLRWSHPAIDYRLVTSRIADGSDKSSSAHSTWRRRPWRPGWDGIEFDTCTARSGGCFWSLQRKSYSALPTGGWLDRPSGIECSQLCVRKSKTIRNKFTEGRDSSNLDDSRYAKNRAAPHQQEWMRFRWRKTSAGPFQR